MKMQPTRLDYCQYLLSSQINYTLTNFADHSQKFSHDQMNRFLGKDKLSPRLIWEQVRHQITFSANGFVIFDDTIIDKNYSFAIELVRRQYSGNTKSVIKGIGVVTCLYVNPESEEFWLIDYRIFAPDEDGKSKLDHVNEMYDLLLYTKALSFSTVLIDAWYATKEFMLKVERSGKVFYCPLKVNRNVDEGSGDPACYQRVDALSWSEEESLHGKSVHVKDFPKGHRLQLFRLVVSTDRTDYIDHVCVVVTNDKTQSSASATQEVCGWRWKIEQLHRECKQLTGLERCQCRRSRIQRNHIACAFLVWCRFKELAYKSGRTVYQIKNGLLSDYLIQQLKSPSVSMAFA